MPWALALIVLALVAAALWSPGVTNVRAFLALIRQAESNGDYAAIAGGGRFDNYAEHPFVLERDRARPLGTTASGAYQMVRGTWLLARDALALPDFSPASQDKAAEWLIRFKVPGENVIKPEGTGNYELVQEGRFDDALEALAPEWESFGKILGGSYHITLAQAHEILAASGGRAVA